MASKLRIASWNVNGLRSYIVDHLPSTKFRGKTEIHPESNLGHLMQLYGPNIICFQETRCGPAKMEQFQIPGWKIYSSSSQGEGGRGPDRYSGVSIWVHGSLGLEEPIKVIDQLSTLPTPITNSDREGRFLALEYPDFTIINTYVPNAGTNYTYRTERWDPAMLAYLTEERQKERLTVWVGDLNVARTPYDVHFGDISGLPQGKRILAKGGDTVTSQLEVLRQKVHANNAMQGIGERAPAGFTKAERDAMEGFLTCGYSDSWRHLNPTDYYQGFTWWNLRIPAYRPNDRGWRIDYVIIDDNHIENLEDCRVFREVGMKSYALETPKKYGSDHAPICVTISRI